MANPAQIFVLIIILLMFLMGFIPNIPLHLILKILLIGHNPFNLKRLFNNSQGVGCLWDLPWIIGSMLSIVFIETETTAIQFMGSEWLVEHAECAGEEGSSNAQLDLDLTLRPPGPTAEEIERELSSFLSSFGNRGVTSSVLKKTKMKLQLDVASPAKLFKIRELMRDQKSRPVPAFQARDALLKALARWERDQTRDP